MRTRSDTARRCGLGPSTPRSRRTPCPYAGAASTASSRVRRFIGRSVWNESERSPEQLPCRARFPPAGGQPSEHRQLRSIELIELRAGVRSVCYRHALGGDVRVSRVEWDEHNRAHFREHERCSEQDTEDVLYSRYYPTRAFAQPTLPGGEPRFMFHGRTRVGRPLKVVATPRSRDVWRPITCIPLSGRDLGVYTAWA